MPAARKTAVPAEEVTEEVAEVGEAPQEEAAPKTPAKKVAEEVEVSPSTLPFVAPNTWTAYYGSKRFDFIEGKKYNLSPEAHAWFSAKSK